MYMMPIKSDHLAHFWLYRVVYMLDIGTVESHWKLQESVKAISMRNNHSNKLNTILSRQKKQQPYHTCLKLCRRYWTLFC